MHLKSSYSKKMKLILIYLVPFGWVVVVQLSYHDYARLCQGSVMHSHKHPHPVLEFQWGAIYARARVLGFHHWKDLQIKIYVKPDAPIGTVTGCHMFLHRASCWLCRSSPSGAFLTKHYLYRIMPSLRSQGYSEATNPLAPDSWLTVHMGHYAICNPI